MDSYRILITGKNTSLIDSMFRELKDDFYMLSCSQIYDDQINHLAVLDPHFFMICLQNENDEELKAYSDLKRRLTSMDVVTIVVGDEAMVDSFESLAAQVADVSIKDTGSVDAIRRTVLDEVERAEREYQEQQMMRQRLEEIKNSMEKKHILVVDDDPVMLKLIKEYLGDKYNVATAVSGKVAHKFLENKSTNLILLDYEMPEENGVEVLRRLRENEHLSEIPVIFLTGVSDKSKLVEALSMKPQGYLLKPIDREKLLGTVEKFIG